MQNERDGIMLELITYRSSEPLITLAQFGILIRSLAELCQNQDTAQALSKSCLESAERLVRQAARSKVTSMAASMAPSTSREVTAASIAPDANYQKVLDSLPDRAGVIDRNYRYVWTNKANASFYDSDPSSFVDVPLREQVGNKCFWELSKPHIDRCFGGHALNHITGHFARNRWYKYLITFDPVRNGDEAIESVLIVARDVSHLPVEPEFIWPARDA